MTPKSWDARAQKLVLAAIEDALAEMREYVDRALLAGVTPDKRMIVNIVRGVQQIADEAALDLTAGPWGGMIEGAMKLAGLEVADIAGATFAGVGAAEIDAALFKSYGLIKGILAEGEKVVAEEVLKSIVGGRSQREVADAVAARLQVANEAGEMGAIPRWRAASSTSLSVATASAG